MLSDSLRRFDNAYEQLWRDLRDFGNDSDKGVKSLCSADIPALERLVESRNFQLKSFEILLRVAPDRAIALLKHRYLEIDLANSAQDVVADLDVMLSDVREILGDERFDAMLEFPGFLEENRVNPRVINAIAFAKDKC